MCRRVRCADPGDLDGRLSYDEFVNLVRDLEAGRLKSLGAGAPVQITDEQSRAAAALLKPKPPPSQPSPHSSPNPPSQHSDSFSPSQPTASPGSSGPSPRAGKAAVSPARNAQARASGIGRAARPAPTPLNGSDAASTTRSPQPQHTPRGPNASAANNSESELRLPPIGEREA